MPAYECGGHCISFSGHALGHAQGQLQLLISYSYVSQVALSTSVGELGAAPSVPGL